MQKITYYNSPVGQILLSSDEQGLTGLWLHSDRFYADNLSKIINLEQINIYLKLLSGLIFILQERILIFSLNYI